MTAQIIDGKALAESLKAGLREQVLECKKIERAPHLVVIQVGSDPASDIYIRNKVRYCRDLGITVTHVRLDATCKPDEVRNLLVTYNYESNIDGIMIQDPLPEQFDDYDWSDDDIQPCRDVDGQTNEQMGALFWSVPVRGELYACTAYGCLKLMHTVHDSLEGLHVVIVGRSTVCGKPLAMMVLREDATVTICHSKTKNLKNFTKQADILVVATGKAGLITPEYVKEGATVIDVGITRTESGKIVGDVAPEVMEVAGHMTPVPGGVGPMTVAMLARNVVRSCQMRLTKED